MKKLQKTAIVIALLIIVAGFVANSGFISAMQDNEYAEIKSKYGYDVTEESVTEVEEIVEETEEENAEEISETEEVAEADETSEEVAEESSVDNRTTENIIWDYLKSAGFTDIQTAAIIGNLYQESGLNSSRVESNGEGIGLVQWSYGRKTKLKNYCTSKGVAWTDLTAQLEFLVSELNSSEFHEPYKSTFANPYSIDEAVSAFCWGFERPNTASANLAYRQKMAWQAYYRNVDR